MPGPVLDLELAEDLAQTPVEVLVLRAHGVLAAALCDLTVNPSPRSRELPHESLNDPGRGAGRRSGHEHEQSRQAGGHDRSRGNHRRRHRSTSVGAGWGDVLGRFGLAISQPGSVGQHGSPTALSSPFTQDGPVSLDVLSVDAAHEAYVLDASLVEFSFVQPGTDPVGGPLKVSVYDEAGASLGSTTIDQEDIGPFFGVVAPKGSEIGGSTSPSRAGAGRGGRSAGAPAAAEFHAAALLSRGADAFERPRDARYALVHQLGGNAREREAKGVGAALDQEVRARDEGDTLVLGCVQERGRVNVVFKREPEEVAALGHDEIGLGDVLAEGLHQRVAAVAERAVHELDVSLEAARLAE